MLKKSSSYKLLGLHQINKLKNKKKKKKKRRINLHIEIEFMIDERGQKRLETHFLGLNKARRIKC